MSIYCGACEHLNTGTRPAMVCEAYRVYLRDNSGKAVKCLDCINSGSDVKVTLNYSGYRVDGQPARTEIRM
jgi:hypothetical protein